GHTLLLGTNSESELTIDFSALEKKFAQTAISEDLKRIEIHEPLDVLKLQILSAAELQLFLKSDANRKLNTENLPVLEYKTPYEFLNQPREILRALSPFWGKTK